MIRKVMVQYLRCLLLLVLLPSTAWSDEFLDPSVAFRPSAQVIDSRTIEVRYEIAKGYYLYRDKFRFAVEPATIRLGPASFPPGKEKLDDLFGKVEVYYQTVAIRLLLEQEADNAQITLRLTSQGCADAGICYPPQQQKLTLQLPKSPTPAATAPTDRTVAGGDVGRIARLLHNESSWLVVVSFFGFGLLLSLTPCVFPMIPILSSIIVGAGRAGLGVSHLRGFLLSLSYVLGMAITYAAAGVAAALTGTLLATSLQNPWILGSFAAVFVVLSLAMFGFYELQVPVFLQSRVTEESRHLHGGSIPGVAAMGALSALIVGPCVAAPLAGALLYIGQTGDALLGGIALFLLALGMGAPLIAVGLSAGSLLPKSGPWMEAVKKAFGVILLATAVWLLTPVIPPVVSMLSWALLLIVPAVYLHALDPLPAHARGWQRFWKGIGIVMLLLGASLLIGTLAGSRDPLQPLSVLRARAAPDERSALRFTRVRSLNELEARLRTTDKPVLLDFYADWCVSCKELERFTFTDPRVQSRLAGWTLLQADVTGNTNEDLELLRHFNLYGPPGVLFFDRTGKEITDARVVGFLSAEEFLAALSPIQQISKNTPVDSPAIPAIAAPGQLL